MKKLIALILVLSLWAGLANAAETVKQAVEADYNSHLADLFLHFHQNPELSLLEHKTAARLAKELRFVGFEVTEGVGAEVDGHPGTGVVAIMKNGPGPLVMMRADMDGLPLTEKSGLAYASKVTQVSPITGKEVPVMHACGHDVHITSLIGTAPLYGYYQGSMVRNPDVGRPARRRESVGCQGNDG